MNLASQFKKHVEHEQLFTNKDRLLLACSGGPDSMVLLHLLLVLGFEVAVAHVNYQLRGLESDEDERFVVDYCDTHHIPHFIKRVETDKLSEAIGKGIQETAREIRYAWLEELRVQHQYKYVLTAHHAGDLAETIVFNFIRGTGVRGLRGIQAITGSLVRPLLFAGKQDILDYAVSVSIRYRTDSSNKEVWYTRNFIRHKIMPLIHALQPSFVMNSLRFSKRMQATAHYYQLQVNQVRSELELKNEKQHTIQLHQLMSMPFAAQLLYELIGELGFNPEVCEQICSGVQSGAVFFSDNRQLLATVERGLLNINSFSEPTTINLKLQASFPFSCDFSFGTYRFEILPVAAYSGEGMWLDADRLEHPLVLRSPCPGDRIRLLGMKGHKKISDFLSESGITTAERKNALLLCNEIASIALLPYRISEDFKVTPETSNCLRITFNPR